MPNSSDAPGIKGGIIVAMPAMTLRLDDDETEALRRRAEDEGRSMQQVMHDALREYVERHETVSWAELASRPPLFTGSRLEIEQAIHESDQDWPGEESG
jgi:plasmid stability protein